MTTPNLTSSLFEWLNYLGSLHVSAIDMGLSRVLPVAEYLGVTHINTQKDKTVFTVAGTNGKGSTTATIATMTNEAGYKTALYQSPHVSKFNERIQINNHPVDDDTLIKAFKQVDDARQLLQQSLSFFEATTLAAMLIFKEAQCDVWVLEIGLGGRLDVVNIINPDVAVITNIGVDHIAWLGDDLEKIGYEKAGILRKNIPCILATNTMPASVWKKATALNNKTFVYGDDYSFKKKNEETWLYSNKAVTMLLPLPNLALENVSAALSAVLASSLNINQTQVSSALSSLNLMGRFYQTHIHLKNDTSEKQIPTIFDALHNPDGARFLIKNLQPQLIKNNANNNQTSLHIVFSMLEDKDIETVVTIIHNALAHAGWEIQWHIAPLNVARATPIDVLLKRMLSVNLDKNTIKTYENIQNATSSAYHLALENDKLLVCGSFHTIADALTVVDT